MQSRTHDNDKPVSTVSQRSLQLTSLPASRTAEPSPVRIVLDACVLWPPSLRDLLLTLLSLEAMASLTMFIHAKRV